MTVEANSQVTGIVTAQELAQHLKVNMRTLQRWRAQAKIPFVKISRCQVRYDLAAVRRALGFGA